MKDILAVAQPIASQTFSAFDPGATAAFPARLAALARAQDILKQTQWQSASHGDVIEQVLQPHGLDRFDVHGPDFHLNARQILSISLALRELAINAAKYGTLFNDRGRARISWAADNGFRLTWQDAGGPPVNSPGTRGIWLRAP